MWRIFIESLIGLILLFGASIVGYEYLIYGKSDPDLVDANLKVEAFRDVMNHVAINESDERAKDLLQMFATKTHRLLDSMPETELPDEIAQYFHEQPGTPYLLDDNDQLWLKFDTNNNYIKMYDDPDSELLQAIEFGDQVVWLFFLASFVAFSSGFIWFLSRRLRVLEKTAVEFASGNFDARASERHWIKLGKLNRKFNKMADEIANLMVNNKALTNAVAHELRTPIFRIQWQCEVLLDQVSSPELKDQLQSIIEDTEDMETLVDELLYYARVERPDAVVHLENIDVAAWLQQHESKWKKDLGVDFSIYVDPSINIDSALNKANHPDNYVPHMSNVDPFLLCRMVVNLLSNAKRYANEKIVVKVQSNEEHLVIQVHDDGCGVPQEHWASLFEPFYRVDKARDRTSGGYGLGLAIVKHIMLRHSGKVSVCNSELGGACFCLIFPHKPAD
ncbi:ATP-binding protein [Vibrio methylphosphonaticus]|uniref:ATP-binding protein n=1 Tax=Vibrio methylphosphonaticus TaxID=2946866 RepID=UPI00202A1589|nr:ATP-binding protein [Vibrio methylphosphonaticus]MCL9773957.1 ATP-binding protein [Vibrio methylphosphonaticus]